MKLCEVENKHELDPKKYQKLVGCLRYLIQTRPDMAYLVGILSPYMQHPRESYRTTIKHVLWYLQGTKAHGINYKRNGDKRLVGYTNSSYNTNMDEGKSITSHVFYYGSSLITWCSQKQYIVALSSCEA